MTQRRLSPLAPELTMTQRHLSSLAPELTMTQRRLSPLAPDSPMTQRRLSPICLTIYHLFLILQWEAITLILRLVDIQMMILIHICHFKEQCLLQHLEIKK
jgi:hypothetical protein